MKVSMIQALCRYVTGASRYFGRRQRNEDEGELPGPLRQFDRNACHWGTVARMRHIMRVAGFQNVRHRGSEWLCNAFSTLPTRMNIMKDQDMLLNIRENENLSAKRHASVIFPDVFGPLTDEDKERYFSGMKFKRCTRARNVLRAAQSISKRDGMVQVINGNDVKHFHDGVYSCF